MKFRGLLLFVTGLLLGGLVVPAAAQTDPTENQLVIRSDGFIFLLRGAQRHLVSPVALTDEEINGYPEGEPFLSGLVPVEALSAAPAGTFGGSTFGSGSTSSSSSTSSSTARAAATATPKPDNSPVDARFKTIPSQVEQNELFKVVIEAPNGSTCEGKVQFKGGKTTNFGKGTTSRNECKMELMVPDDAKIGDADVKATVKNGGQSTEFEDVTEIVAAGKSGSSNGDVKLDWGSVPSSIKQDERLEFTIKTEKGASCEGVIEFNGGEEEDFDETDATNKGECKMEVDIPANAKVGKATIRITVSKGDEESEDDKQIDIKKK
ncbi:MAG: hypothetical protein ACKVVP_18435 [Chloroflexota bacterium]